MVHLVLLNRPSKPICVANMLVALMYFAVVREQKNWINGKRYVGFFFYLWLLSFYYFYLFIIIIYLLLLLLFFHIGILYFLVQWVSTLRQWMLTRGQHLVHG